MRRLKENRRDLNGRRLFPDRHAQTVTFRLNRDEYALYKAVTAYINEFLPQASGSKKQSVALTRTVFQRRLASSTNAIHKSLRRRLEKQKRILEELEALPPGQRPRYLERLRGRLTDVEQDEGQHADLSRVTIQDQLVERGQREPLLALLSRSWRRSMTFPSWPTPP
jgi:hypothetical protein